ncbi:MAG TPA: hypothetical protein VFJ82_01245 [Longimicrobium sp.]|nr:hypothetical protein [Longimicrobium sp.]
MANDDSPATGVRQTAAAGSRHPAPATLPHCRCGTPLHPDHVEMHRGKLLERYSCPRRRWWNHLWHPHAWMEPREGVAAP